MQEVTTDSTSPPEAIFTKDAETIARIMAKPEVSPRGISSAIRMVQYCEILCGLKATDS